MNENDLARGVLARLISSQNEIDFSTLTDAELNAILASPQTERDRATVRRVSGGRTDELSKLTDDELNRIIAGLPPVERNSHE